MSEYRDYVSQNQDNGAIHISEDVITSIVEMTVAELDGMGNSGAFGKKGMVRDVDVTFGENNELTIDCEIYISVDHSIMDTAKSVQDAVASAVESVTGLRVVEVNVKVSGIVLPRVGNK